MSATGAEAAPRPSTAQQTGRPVLVGRVETLATDVVGVELLPADGGVLPAWEPGAHIDVELGPGLVRQYSLCGDPADRERWRIAVLLRPDGGGGSRRVHELSAGDVLVVRGPRNHFALRPSARYVFVAGGIGITPVLPMLAAADAAGAEWVLHYGGRSRTSMAFLPELARYADRVRLHPQDEVGPLDLDRIVGGIPPGTSVYCCGPAGLLDVMAERSRAWPPGTLRVERFAASGRTAPSGGADSAPDTAPDTGTDTAFEVECRASGVTVQVAPDRSILDAVEAAGGVVVASSCREGICGTCETAVLDGVPDHRDEVLDESERAAGEVMMICVSRAAGARLVLDL